MQRYRFVYFCILYRYGKILCKLSRKQKQIQKLKLDFLYIIFQQLQDPDFTICSISIAVSSQLAIAFVFCYFGKLATDSFQCMSDCVFYMNWHELPIALQKYVIIMIANMQKPLHYHGSGIVIMDLNTFINVS